MPRRRAAVKGRVTALSLGMPSTCSLGHWKAMGDSSPPAFRKVIVPRVKLGGELEEQKGRGNWSVREGGRRRA